MPRNFIWRLVGGIHLNAMITKSPSAVEWDNMLNEFQRDISQVKGLLIYTEGGAPNALQRKKLRETHEQHNTTLPKSALLTTSLIARAAMTALNLFFDNRFKAFSPNEIDEALHYLSVPPASWPEIKRSLEELKTQLKREQDQP